MHVDPFQVCPAGQAQTEPVKTCPPVQVGNEINMVGGCVNAFSFVLTFEPVGFCFKVTVDALPPD